MSDLISKSAIVDRLSEEAKRLTEIAIHSKGQAGDYYTGRKTGMARAAIIATCFTTIDAVPVVRCKKCKWWVEKHPRLGIPWCRQMHIDKSEDGYCDSGERREE